VNALLCLQVGKEFSRLVKTEDAMKEIGSMENVTDLYSSTLNSFILFLFFVFFNFVVQSVLKFNLLICHLKGKMIFPNGDVYEGSFENDVINGKGKLVTKNGLIYEGEWKDDQFHGKGRLQYPNGMVYEGSFEYGLKSGRGVLKYPSGAVYEGDWVNDQVQINQKQTPNQKSESSV
jgi:hypothetical protein